MKPQPVLHRIRRAHPDETEYLFAIWEAAVAATHDFIAPADRAFYADLVRERYLPRARIAVATGAGDEPLGFIGMAAEHIEALFVHPDHARCGIGRALVAHARKPPGWRAVSGGLRAVRVDVNEENWPARAFYARLGFQPTGRSRLDACGRPYPILHLRLEADVDFL
ncbi:MAG: acetyltransferase [Salinarimonas sp.]|nr:acetyltransferase [Salinarimonas sp.]